jgi:phage N-6-adenine-methyltransferase
VSGQDRTRSARDDWPTPQWLADQLAAEFGPFGLDPCATASNAKAPVFYTEADDGLSQPWKGRVWLNPPYGGQLGYWMAKAVDQVETGNAGLVVALVPARPGVRWYDEATRSASLARVRPGRRVWPRANFTVAELAFGQLAGRHGTTAKDCTACGVQFFPRYASRETCSERCRKAHYRSREMSRFPGRIRDTGRR